MLTDTIADFLTQVKNGYMARKENIKVSYSKMNEGLANLLSKEGYLGKIETKKADKLRRTLLIDLVYVGKEPKLTDIKRVSRISRRIYAKKNEIPKVLGGLGITIVSTPSGLMTGSQARKKGLGGEIICKVW